MSDPKYVSRFPPCPVCDVEGLESWLEDLAKQGLFLTKGGLFCGFAEFQKASPASVRYRLQPLPKKRALEDRRPDDAALELAAEYGWTYLCNLGEHAVYSCSDPNARELDTDPQVQAVSLNQLFKRKRNDWIFTLLVTAAMIGFLLWVGPISYALTANGWYLGFVCLILVSYPFFAGFELRQLRRLRQKLLFGTPLSRVKNWRKKRWLHWLTSACCLAVYLSFGVLIFVNNFYDWEDSRWQTIEEYQQEIPFATMEDLAGVGTFEPDGMFAEEDHHIAERATLLAPRQIKLQQFGQVVAGSDVLMDGILEIEYYALRSPRLAKAMYRELHRHTFGSQTREPLFIHYHDALALTDLPTEQEAAYSGHFPTLLLQEGSVVVKAQLTQFKAGQRLTLDQWGAILASSLIS